MIRFILHIHIYVVYSSVCNYRIVLILSITCMIIRFSWRYENLNGILLPEGHVLVSR